MLRTIATVLGIALLAAVGVVWLAGQGTFGRFDSVGARPEAPARDARDVAADATRRAQGARTIGASRDKQVLFGDLHVHTTISFDAFMFNLPIHQKEGSHPPSDACDFARHCAALDFWSINDHAANIHPDDWQETIAAVRQCDALAGDGDDPDLVSFLGWEWTQAGLTPETHFGHKNVVLRGLSDAEIPTRPIAASAGGTAANGPSVWARGALAVGGGGRFHDLARRWTALGALDVCAPSPVRELPESCREIAPTPAELFAKLDDWGHDSIVIPHGTAWGIYTPGGSTWDKQLAGELHDPDRQFLFELYSGHGESEVYRDWRAVTLDEEGAPGCPPPRDDYLSMCQRAGEIVRERCTADGLAPEECDARAAQARAHAAAAGPSPQATLPGAEGPVWQDAGQCRDCAQPAFKYRPGGSAQYVSSIGNFDEEGQPPRRFRFGFMASSDIHSARAGSGYKEVGRIGMTDAQGSVSDLGVLADFLTGAPEPPVARSRSVEEAREVLSGLQLYETERTGSFLYTGGLVAVHAEGRDRDAVWDALGRREVYGTSGPRILLWFDLLNGDAGPVPMGGEARVSDVPIFQVRAVGSFEQQPGCPDAAVSALGTDEVERLCLGECYHPSDSRRPLTRIEVVRIRPQQHPDDAIGDRIEDPWRSFDCDPDPAGCVATFSDPGFDGETVYYARVFEAPKPTINGGSLRCTRDDGGRCVEMDLCADADSPGDCLAPDAPRAWSSPIFVDPPPAA